MTMGTRDNKGRYQVPSELPGTHVRVDTYQKNSRGLRKHLVASQGQGKNMAYKDFKKFRDKWDYVVARTIYQIIWILAVVFATAVCFFTPVVIVIGIMKLIYVLMH